MLSLEFIDNNAAGSTGVYDNTANEGSTFAPQEPEPGASACAPNCEVRVVRTVPCLCPTQQSNFESESVSEHFTLLHNPPLSRNKTRSLSLVGPPPPARRSTAAPGTPSVPLPCSFFFASHSCLLGQFNLSGMFFRTNIGHVGMLFLSKTDVCGLRINTH